MVNANARGINEYITTFPAATQMLLQQLRDLIEQTEPAAEGCISYAIPAYQLNGKPLVYFAGFKKHVSLYPAPRNHADFKEALSTYKGGKGTVQFELDKPLPRALIKKIIRFRVYEIRKTKAVK